MIPRLTLGGVPLHPALVHFPVVLWVLTPGLDAAYAVSRSGAFWSWSWYLTLAGLISAVPAAIAGALDAAASLRVEAAQATVWRHAGLMSVTWTVFALSLLFGGRDAPADAWILGCAMHSVGSVLLMAGAHAGGRLAYVYRLPAALHTVTSGAAPEASRQQDAKTDD